MTKELKAIRDALEGLINQYAESYPNVVAAADRGIVPDKIYDDARQAISTLDSIMSDRVVLPLFGYEICGADFFAGTMKNNGGKVDDIWWLTDITDYSDDAIQRLIKRVEFINRAMNTAAPKHGGEV